MREGYDQAAPLYAEAFPDTRAEIALDLAMLDAFTSQVRTTPDGRVLDAGCGTGRLSRHLADNGCDVDGLDLSPGMLAIARRERPGLASVVGSVTELPFRDDAFDGVLLWYSLIHLPPDALPLALAETARVLRPGGAVLIGAQSGEGTRDVAWSYVDVGGHEPARLQRHLVTADRIAHELESVGLRAVAQLTRRGQGAERDDQCSVLATSR